MSVRTEIKKSNDILRELDGLFPNLQPSGDSAVKVSSDGVHQKFKWIWSSTLYDLVPAYTIDGNPIYNYYCNCGMDVKVHAASCSGMTIPVTKIVKMQLVDPNGPYGAYPNMWMLCRWNPPISKEEWIDQMGSERDYSPEGNYRPVSRGAACVVIPPRAVPSEFVATTHKIVDMMREHSQKQAEQMAETMAPKLEVPIYNQKGEMIDAPHKGAKFWALKDQLAAVMRRFNPGATVGYGKKSADFNLQYSDRSLADHGSPLHRQREQERKEMAEEVRKEVSKEVGQQIPAQEG